MNLPQIDVPIFELKLPSTGEEIRVRPFLVKEEKMLLIAAESGDTNDIINTTKQVISNCLVDKNINVNTLPFFDIDFLFIALRAKSISDKVAVSFVCKNETEEGICNQAFDTELDLSAVSIKKNVDVKSDIKLDAETLVKMKYPNYGITKTVMGSESILEKKIRIIAACIDRVIKKDKIFSSRDFTPDQIVDFVEGLTEAHYKKLEEFIDNFPYFYIGVNHICEACGFNHRLEYKDFTSFFQ